MKLFTLSIPLVLMALVANAGQDYKADTRVGQDAFKSNIKDLAVSGEKLYALEDNGTVQVFNTASGEKQTQIVSGSSNVIAIAVDKDEQVYVLSHEIYEHEYTRNNQKRKGKVITAVIAKIFDAKGKEVRSTKYGEVKSVRDALFVGETLVVADKTQRKLIMLNPATGEKTGEKGGLRLCCGIFDICNGPENTIGVSNLGAFKVQQHGLDGKLLKSFGQRGRELNDFHGCCNPVSSAFLPGGNIVTVEKSPTRIKIYDPEGKDAKLVEGVEELVKGCSHIPVVVDGKGNIFLANPRAKYLVKCVPKE